jgi:hypothetical protein
MNYKSYAENYAIFDLAQIGLIIHSYIRKNPNTYDTMNNLMNEFLVCSQLMMGQQKTSVLSREDIFHLLSTEEQRKEKHESVD